jgi:prepilin-type N-terminal cleavage/methylation domain-containing protein
MTRRHGFTMVEVLVSIVIVSGMFLAALHAAAVAQTSQHRLMLRQQSQLLAEDLAAEMDQMPFQDPGVTSGFSSLGPGGDERGPTRALFDDVDDYDDWSSSPPQLKDGTELTWAASLTRAAEVEWVSLTDPGQPSGSATGLLRCTVTVSLNEGPLADVRWLRSYWWPDPAKTKGAGQ